MEKLPIKDRAAIVLYGIVGGMVWRDGHGAPTNISDCAKTLKFCVASRYDCDVFIHSWSIDHKNELLDHFCPIDHLIQPQEMFGFNLSKEDKVYGDFPSPGSCFRAMSRWVSTKRAIELKQKHEQSSGFRYRYVMVPRIDLVYMSVIDFNKFDPGNIYVCREPVFCPDNFIDPRFNTHCLDDKIFLSSSENIDRFAEVEKDLRMGRYGSTAWNSHLISYDKAIDIVGEQSKIKFGFETYIDVDVYRTAVNYSNGLESARRDYCETHGIDMPKQLKEILDRAE